MIDLQRVCYVRLGTRDLEGATRFATDVLGLEIGEVAKGAIYFKSDEREHTLCYVEGDPREQAVAFEVGSRAALAAAAGELERLGGSRGTLVMLMAVQRIGAVVAELRRHGRSPDTPVFVIADGTMPTQRTINSTLEQVDSRIAEEGVRPPAIVVVGNVVNVAAEITELMRHVSAFRTG